MSVLIVIKTKNVVIGHFPITLGLFFKASPGAHPVIWKLVFIHMQMKTNFHTKEWAPGLGLKKMPKLIWKCARDARWRDARLFPYFRSFDQSNSSFVVFVFAVEVVDSKAPLSIKMRNARAGVQK